MAATKPLARGPGRAETERLIPANVRRRGKELRFFIRTQRPLLGTDSWNACSRGVGRLVSPQSRCRLVDAIIRCIAGMEHRLDRTEEIPSSAW